MRVAQLRVAQLRVAQLRVAQLRVAQLSDVTEHLDAPPGASGAVIVGGGC
jgi:hypothetical protein